MISSRIVLLALASVPLAACGSLEGRILFGSGADDLSSWYIGSRADQPFDIPLVDRTRMRPEFRPQTVAYSGSEAPGTVVVEVDRRFLFLVEEGGTARRYGIGVGRQGFSWKGTATVQRKAVWPDWSPTTTMVSLNPDLPRRLKGGIDNPLGARALYL
jgi:lipoprotein-anchoring transpeptidase ErfK/SrfK